MEDITEYKGYAEFKADLDADFKEVTERFVRIGYKLKVARDTDILKESGYKTVAQFAEAEYKLTKDIVSRWIAINDKYAKNGYSPELDDKYKQYGVAKLAIMVTLPDGIADELTPNLTKKQFQEVKKEFSEENKITDLEVMMENKEAENVECITIFEKTIYEWLKNNKGIYEDLIQAAETGRTENVIDVLAPTGTDLLIARVAGTGKLMISIKGKEENITVTNMRTSEKEIFTWQQAIDSLVKMYSGKKCSEVYPEEKPKVAPVQPEKNPEEDKPETEEKANKFNPEPEQMESICYKCQHWKDCDRKSTITTQCNAYIDKAEAEKTEEQKYNEEQDKIDRKTAKILKERADEEKMNSLPGDSDLKKIHQIRIANTFYDDVASGKKSFELRKNDRDYKVGDGLEMMEFKDGKNTGRIIKANIIYMLEEYKGLEEGYCILGIDVEAADE